MKKCKKCSCKKDPLFMSRKDQVQLYKKLITTNIMCYDDFPENDFFAWMYEDGTLYKMLKKESDENYNNVAIVIDYLCGDSSITNSLEIGDRIEFDDEDFILGLNLL